MQIFINYISNYVFLAFGLFMYVFFNINITETITKKKKTNVATAPHLEVFRRHYIKIE